MAATLTYETGKRMDHDIVIRGGALVDGSGAGPISGDLAIRDGRITAIGNVSGRGGMEIDARDRVVTPGFVDIHTHLDAQMGWDPDMTPVSWHGVTTALIGNCGMTFAPCRPEDRELLAGMMETVEDIPKEAILSGLAWDWEHYGEYLASIEKLGTAVNVAGMVGHAAVRYYVMGDRSFAENATPAELEEMAAIVGRSLDDGAWGFSTNRFAPHRAPDGRSIPGTFAEVAELERIAAEVGPRNALVQAVGADFGVMRAIADAARSRVLFSYALELYDDGERLDMGVADVPDEDVGRRAAAALDALCGDRDITAIAHVRGSGFIFGLQSNLPVQGETWGRLAALDFPRRITALADADTVGKLIEEARQDGSIRLDLNRCFYMGDGETPDYTGKTSLAAEAAAAGEHWAETFLRVSRETGGRALFNYRMFAGSLDAQARLFESDHLYPGLGDAGAHVSQIMDAGWPSFMLSHWHRATGFYNLGRVIERMTSGPARVIGLVDRGLLREGMVADVNVIDLDNVAELQPRLVHDFPGGAPRYIQAARGFDATIVNGRLSLQGGERIGDRSGQVLRRVSR